MQNRPKKMNICTEGMAPGNLEQYEALASDAGDAKSNGTPITCLGTFFILRKQQRDPKKDFICMHF